MWRATARASRALPRLTHTAPTGLRVAPTGLRAAPTGLRAAPTGLRAAPPRVLTRPLPLLRDPPVRPLCANSRASPSAAPRRTLSEDIKEYAAAEKAGGTASFDPAVIPVASAHVFPRIKTTSLSTKRVVIHDKAARTPLTLVLVAFRSFADKQLATWRDALRHLPDGSSQWYDVTINESFGAQALSGFIQRWQRSRTDPALHDYFVAFNSKAREPLESLLLSRNRMFGYALLLDRRGRVRFRASGMASEQGVDAFLTCARQILEEDANAEKEALPSDEASAHEKRQ